MSSQQELYTYMTKSPSSALLINEMGSDQFKGTKYAEKWGTLQDDIKQLELVKLEYRESINQQKKCEARLATLLKICQSADKDLQREILNDLKTQGTPSSKGGKGAGNAGPINKNVKANLQSNLMSKEDEACERQEKLDKKAALALMKEEKKFLEEVRKLLPQKNSTLLNLAIGDVNVTFPSIAERVQYKQKYETFKLKMTIIGIAFAFMYCVFVHFGIHQKILEPIFQIFMVWYYSTLILREHVLISNGSSIKGWWLTHHYLSIMICIIMAVFPDGVEYQYFYNIYNLFSLYVGLAQLLQFRYQKARLYTLRALGKADPMDVSAEGIQVKSTLIFLVPVLVIGQLWQIVNGYILFDLFMKNSAPVSALVSGETFLWHPLALAILFTIVGAGNLYTTLSTLYVRYILKKRMHANPNRFNGIIFNQPSSTTPSTTPSTLNKPTSNKFTLGGDQ